MNKKKLLFLLLLSSLAYSMEEKSNVEGEVTFGVDATFGADGAETVVRLFPPMIDLLRPMKYSDYEAEVSGGSAAPNNVQEPEIYIPEYDGLNRDVELAVKYLSKNAELRKRLGVKLKENYLGLGIKVDVLGKQISHTQFLGNNEIDKLKISLTSENKYVNGEINYYAIGESKDKVDIDKIDTEKPLKNKVVDYNFSINPIPDKSLSVSLDFEGQDKNLNIGPTLKYRNGGTYVNTSVLFNNVKSNYDLEKELHKIKHTAPGYDKIEYFKKWTLKEEYKNPPAEISKEKYENEYADLEKAEVSGIKGTQRILGHYSGSLYGDSPFRYIAKNVFDEIHSNPNFSNISSVTKVLEKDEKPGLTSFSISALQSIGSEIGNKNEMNKLAEKLAIKMYKRLGVPLDRKYSSIGVWTQIPSEFAYLLPGYFKDFDYTKIKSDELDADYLYDNGMKKPPRPSEGYDNGPLVVSDTYKLKERWHYFGPDMNKYVLNEIGREYKFDKIKELANTSTTGLVLDGILGAIFGGGKIQEVIKYLPTIQDIVKNPYEIKGIDMLRGMYLHQSEKERNMMKYEDELKESFSDVDLKDNKARYSTKIRLNAGHFGKNYKVGGALLLNDNIYVDSEKYGYIKKSNHLGFDAMYKEGLIEFDTKMALSFAKNNLFRKDNSEKYVYDTVNLNTDTYFGLDIPSTDKFNVGLGIRHIGDYGWINPKSFTDKNGDKIKWNNIAKRDNKNNPIGKEGETIIVSETTEKVLVEKEATTNTKLKRDIHQSDYISTVESDPVKSTYEVYNIVSPRITMRYRPYNNYIFSTHLEVPISIRKDAPAGIRGIYSGEIKYLIDDSFADTIFSQRNPIKFKTSGNIEAGAILGSDLGYYLGYKAMADATFLRADIDGNDKDIDFSLSLNPLIANFSVKPRLILAKEGKEIVTKLGLEYSKDTEFSSVLGFRKIIKSKNEILKEKLIPEILETLKDRNEKEYERISEKVPRITFDKKLEYILTPFVDIRKEEGDFKINIKASSIKGNAEERGSTETTGEETPRASELEGKSKDYLFWTYKNYYKRPRNYVYFKKLNYDQTNTRTEYVNKLDYEKYNFSVEAKYDKGLGIDFNTKLDISYEFKQLKGTGKETKTTNSYWKLKGFITDGTYDNSILNLPENDVVYDENAPYEDMLKFAVDKGSDYISRYRELYKGSSSWFKMKESELIELLKKTPEVKVETKENEETLLLENKKIIGKLDTYLGYNFNPIEKLILSVGAMHNLKVDYTSMNKVIVEDEKLFGSRKITINNTISPEFGVKYDIFKGLNATLRTSMPFDFENKDFKGLKFNIKTGLEYKW
ncbi:hypothetical protein HP397_02760 [Streptobacillus felis]|uniref:Cell surface protein SprA n=1 Tax=Streptobacillus felis TaxID=1384509 RepID=A0A7Z0PEV4_9FUSO|nr:hypothetical protein [Streptobacillus felis]NYV27749.1 hypothetical protein [Streptobacillus felis]